MWLRLFRVCPPGEDSRTSRGQLASQPSPFHCQLAGGYGDSRDLLSGSVNAVAVELVAAAFGLVGKTVQVPAQHGTPVSAISKADELRM
jgi:hypothetical protein